MARFANAMRWQGCQHAAQCSGRVASPRSGGSSRWLDAVTSIREDWPCRESDVWDVVWKPCWVAPGTIRRRRPRRRDRRPKSPADDRISRDEHGQVWLNCDAIERNPYQPRQTFDEAEIADLADSIRTHGILQPLVVRRVGRRLRADRRRAPAPRGPGRRLAASARADPRRRRPPDGRAGHRRKRPAQGPQRDRKGRVVPAVHRSIPLHAGRAGRRACRSTARPSPT